MSKIPNKPEGAMYTDQQWQAIFETGHHVLVSASAGSGKTRILVQRVIEKIKQGHAIDELLIVTFTEAAAKEMKQRIEVALKELLHTASAQERQWFLKQIQLLPTAMISTLHAFCLRVIRKYYYVLDLEPGFRLLTDETERLLLKEEVMETLIEEAYEAKTTEFYAFVENFMSDRSDQMLGELLLQLYEFSRANPDPVAWLDALPDAYKLEEDITKTPLYQTCIKVQIAEKLGEAKQQLLKAHAYSQQLDKLALLLETEQQQITRLLAYLEQDQIDLLYEALTSISFDRFPSYRKAEDKESAQLVKPLRELAKQLVQEASVLLPYPPEQMRTILAASQPIVKEAVRLVHEFMARYQKSKQQKNILDFNDLEHLTLAILQVKTPELDVQAAYRDSIHEVLVDEYQDINRLQQAILESVATHQPGNLFMVGDVKQSIYAFRLADPTLFIEKYDAFKAHQMGEKIDLKENFRSRQEVLAFTNLIFEQLMDQRVGQIDYQDEARLVSGATYYPEGSNQQLVPELLIYEKQTTAKETVISTKTEGEIHLVAQKIRDLIEQRYPIFDRKTATLRPLSYQDIVLLTPTRSAHLTMIDIFQEYQLPLAIKDAQNYFQATEIKVMLSLLQIIDNPLQDIPLVSVLRSPIVGLNESELADIRLEHPDSTFYQAVVCYPEEHVLLKPKLTRFLDQLNAWRELAKRQPIATVLQDIYAKTAYPDYVLGLPSGEQRYANLMALVNRAQRYEETSFRGLYPFIRFIEKMREKNKDLSQPVAKVQEESIQVMTIHASKGLEFPVVFVMDMTKEVNTQDLVKPYLMDEHFGLGVKWIDKTRTSFTSLPYMAIQQIKLVKLLSEEMRKLYVALTRAEQKLFLVGSYKTQEEALGKWSKALSQTEQFLDPQLRLSTKASLMDWIGMTLVRHPLFEPFLEELRLRGKKISHDGQFSFAFVDNETLYTRYQEMKAQLAHTPQQIFTTTEFGALSDTLVKRLNYVYPYEKATKTSSYQSVSEIKRLYNDPDEQELQLLDWNAPQEKAYRQVDTFSQPKFLAKKEVKATVMGQATHYLLQQVDLTKKPTKASLEQQKTALLATKQFPSEMVAAINIDHLVWFFDTPLGQELLQQPQRVFREQPFSMLKAAADIYQDFDDPHSELLIHGIIDGYIEYDESIVLYDFKTDHIRSGQTAMQLAERYRGQLRLYKQALEQSLGKEVIKTYLVLLSEQNVLSL